MAAHQNNFFLKAFSVIDILIALVVSTIILAIVFIVFNLLNIQIDTITKEENKKLENNKWQFLVQKDVFESIDIKIFPEVLYFKKEQDHVHYLITENYIVREMEHITDTFLFKKATVNVDTVFNNKQTNYFMRIKFQFQEQEEESYQTYNFYKPLYAKQLIDSLKI